MEERKGKQMLAGSMVIFGTIGILRKFIPYSSGFVALVRGFVGAVFLLAVLTAKGQRPDTNAIRKNALPLLLSGGALGFNWIFLFEAYAHTSVATATLCYYLAPILVILVSPIFLKEALTAKKLGCTLVALIGMVLVSGVTDSGFSGIRELKGIGFGLAAAVLYAAVMLLNKTIRDIGPYDKTISQLFLSACIMLPYVLLTEDLTQIDLTPLPLSLLLVAGIVHTGIAYWLYFGSMGALKAHTIALYSYIDPILAIILSMLVLREPMTAAAAVGAVLILSAAYISEK